MSYIDGAMRSCFRGSLLLPLVCLFGTLQAQNVAINATGAAPAASAMLDITSTSSGLLVPRVALTATNAAAPIAAPAHSLLLYNTATAGAAPWNVTPGYYHWDTPTARWVRFASDGDAWRTTGNAGTVPAANFLGTTDAQALRIRTANTERLEVAATGEVRAFGDGTATAPVYSWTTNTNMGQYRIAANTWGLSTAGTERMRVTPAGTVAINNPAPAATAQLDVSATNKGVLIPRVALTSMNSNVPVGAGIVTSMLVYNTATAGAAPNNVFPGYYFWDGTRWRRFVDTVTDLWYYPPFNVNALTLYTVTATIPGVTVNTAASVVLSGDWATSPDVVIEHVEARTGAVRFKVYNPSFTNYVGMDFIIMTMRP